MPNITTRLGQYCVVHGYEHKEEYLVCDSAMNTNLQFIITKDITTMVFLDVAI
jgi:hypothetical protein